MRDGTIILLFFAAIFLIPTGVIFLVLAIARARRSRRRERYTGVARGTIVRITHRGLDAPWVIYAAYRVNGVEYCVKETAKLRKTAIKIGKIPIGQRSHFVLGTLREGISVTIRYEEAHPERAIIEGNEGWMTG